MNGLHGPDRRGILLLVADDLMFPSRVREGARPVGYDVRVESTLDGARTAASAAPSPVAILVYLHGRRYDPLAVITALKADPATRSIPLLAIAGHAETEKHRAARQAGADRTAANSSIALYLPQLLEKLLHPTNAESADVVLEILPEEGAGDGG